MDAFRKGAAEWGSKARKEERGKCRAKLKRDLPQMLAEAAEATEAAEAEAATAALLAQAG